MSGPALKLLIYALPVILTGVITSCISTKIVRQQYLPSEINKMATNGKHVKVHTLDGGLYLLDSTNLAEATDTVRGTGHFFDASRNLQQSILPFSQFPFVIPTDQIALIETNDIQGVKNKLLGLTLVGVGNTALLIYCMINPKACFGSCPTFYAPEGNEMSLMAEGFSSSILKSFEQRDIDMLYRTKASGDEFHLRLTNEALETHVVRSADLLIFPTVTGERIFATDQGGFYKTDGIRSPDICTAGEGDILKKISFMDQDERFVPTDSNDLLKKEEIEMEFSSVPSGELGLVVGCRQTFLTTFLFYQCLSYLGHSAGTFAAAIESGDVKTRNRVNRIWDLLGGIEVFVQNSRGGWEPAGQILETGPIASDVHLLRLPEKAGEPVRIKLRMTRGLWRIDYLALGRLAGTADPVKIAPSRVESAEGPDENAKALLNDSLQTLITLPGDVYDLYYDLPGDAGEYEFFLSSRGYYIEWMRESWLAEENLKKAVFMFGFPGWYMKMAAPEFKKLESSMEENFWRSRYVGKN